MITSDDKLENIPATDPIDVLIFEKGLRIRTLLIVKDLDLFLLVLSNGKVIKSRVSIFKSLKKASQKELDGWAIRANGTGISWEKLNEDLSLRGFIRDASLQATLNNLENTGNIETFVA